MLNKITAGLSEMPLTRHSSTGSLGNERGTVYFSMSCAC
jgi:hypothetical protein